MRHLLSILIISVAACSRTHAGGKCETSGMLLPGFSLLARADTSADFAGVEVIIEPDELVVNGEAIGGELDPLKERLESSRAAKQGVVLVIAPAVTWARIVDIVRAIETTGAHRIGFVFESQPKCAGVVWDELDDAAPMVHYPANATWADIGKELPGGSRQFAVAP